MRNKMDDYIISDKRQQVLIMAVVCLGAFMDNVLILLISGGSKDTQEKDIKKAKEYWQEIKKERIEK